MDGPEDISQVDLRLLLENVKTRAGLSDKQINDSLHSYMDGPWEGEGISSRTLADIRNVEDPKNVEGRKKMDGVSRRRFIEKIAYVTGWSMAECIAMGTPDGIRPAARAASTSGTAAPDGDGSKEAFLRVVGDSVSDHVDGELRDWQAHDPKAALERYRGHRWDLVALDFLRDDDRLLEPPDWTESLQGIKAGPRFLVGAFKPSGVDRARTFNVSLAGDMVGAVAAVHRLRSWGPAGRGLLPFDVRPIIHGLSGAKQALDLRQKRYDAHFAVLGTPSRLLNRIDDFRLVVPLYKRPIYGVTRVDDHAKTGRLVCAPGGFGEFVARKLGGPRGKDGSGRGRPSLEEFHPVARAERLDEGEALMTIDPFVGRIARRSDSEGRPLFRKYDMGIDVTVGLFVNCDIHPIGVHNHSDLTAVAAFTQAFLHAYALSVMDPLGTRALLMEDEGFVKRHAATIDLPSPR